MPAKRSAMRKIKDVLRLKFEAKLSHEKIAAATGMSKGAVTNAVQRALQKGLAWPLAAVFITNSCPILQELMSIPVALKPVSPIFQVLRWWITQIPLRFWTSIADKG